jgi:hypothetical protein
MHKGKCWLIGWGIFPAVFVILATPAPDSPGAVVFQPPASYDRGRPMTFTARTDEKPEWITIFFRFAATAEFAPRPMAKDAAGGYSTTLGGDELLGERLEYYLAFKIDGQIRYLPEEVPARFFSTPASAQAMPEAPPAAPSVDATARTYSLALAVDGSVSGLLGDPNAADPDPRFLHGENLRLGFQAGRDKLQVLFDARLQYNSVPPGGQEEFSFADGRLRIGLGRHSLQAGKISPSGSELGLQPFERNGLAYTFSGASWQLNLFTLATRQLPGFEGFIVPKEGASLFGASIDFSLLNRSVSIQATGFSGKDDPALGIHAGFTPAFKNRRGDLISLAATASLWKNSLALAGELAFSHSDLDTTDALASMNGSAWRCSGRYSRGFLDLHASLKNIGAGFDSIGQPFMVSDRRSLDAGMGIHFAGLRLNIGYLAQRDNTAGDDAVPIATDSQIQVGLGWDFFKNASLQLGYSRGQNNLPATVLSPIGGGFDKEGFSGTLSWRPGRWTSLQLSAQRDAFSSVDHPEMDGHSLTLNAGWNFQRPDRFALSGQMGVTQASYSAAQQDGTFYYAFVNGELAIVSRLLSLSLVAAYNRSEPGIGDSQQTASLDGGLVLRTPRAWKLGLVMAALRANWRQNVLAEGGNDYYRFYLKCDFSLGGR